MSKSHLNNKGFGAIQALLILVVILVIGFVGWSVWHHKRQAVKSTGNSAVTQKPGPATHESTKTDPYEGWQTFESASLGISFKYPSDWSIPTGGIDESGIELHSPVANGYYFNLAFASGPANPDLNLNFLGNGSGTTILNLDVSDSSSPLYLVAAISGASNTTGLALATTPGNNKTAFGILDNGGHGDHNIVMYAYLVSAENKAAVNNTYSLQTYQSQTNYPTILNIFKSLSFK